MKTNLISKAVVMVAVVMASVMNFSASASNPTQYVSVGVTEVAEQVTVFVLKDSLCGHQFAGHLFVLYVLNDTDATLMLASTK